MLDESDAVVGHRARGPSAPRPAGRVPAPLLVLLAGPMSFGLAAPALVLDETADGLGVTVAAATWIVTAFGGGVAVGTPLAGGLVARRGARAAVLACAAAVAAGTFLGAAVPVLPVLVVAGVLQGLGAGGLTAAALSLAATPRVTGLVTASLAVIGAVSPLTGSFLAGATSWRVVHVLPAVALLAVPFVARDRSLAPAADRPPGPADRRGALLLTALIAGLVLVPYEPVAGTAGAVVAAVALAAHVDARPDGFVPRALVRAPGFAGPAALGFALAVSNFGILYAGPRLLGRDPDRSAAEIGFVMLWPYLAGGALSWFAVARAQRARPAVVTAALVTAGVVAPVVVATDPPVPVLLAAMAVGSVTAASGQAILTVRAAAVVPGRHRPTALGLFSLCFLLGPAFGPAIVAVLLDGG